MAKLGKKGYLPRKKMKKLAKVTDCSLEATFSESVSYIISIVFHVLLAFIIPYFVLLMLNVATLRCLHSSSKKKATGSRQQLHRKITVMMLVVCFTFIILWLPKTIILMTSSDAHSHNTQNNETLASLAALSGMLNSALNFLLYCFTVKRFRDEARNQLRRIFCCKADDYVGSISKEKLNKLWKSTDKRKNSSQSSANESGRNEMFSRMTKVIHKANANRIDHVTLLVGENQSSLSDRSSTSI